MRTRPTWTAWLQDRRRERDGSHPRLPDRSSPGPGPARHRTGCQRGVQPVHPADRQGCHRLQGWRRPRQHRQRRPPFPGPGRDRDAVHDSRAVRRSPSRHRWWHERRGHAAQRQEVVRAETAAAELDAQRQEKLLESSVRKPADAKAYEQVTLAEANRAARVAAAQAQAEDVRLAGAAQANATQLNGAAQASAIRENGLAEAAGIEARAKALSTNQDAVIAQQYAENYPAIVAAAASSLGNIDNLVVLNGADGTEDLLAKAMTMGGAGLGLAQQLLSSIRNDKPVHPNTAKKANTILVPANGKVDHASA